METKQKLLKILNDIIEQYYPDVSLVETTDNERLQTLPYDSMNALMFVTTVEDEFQIEFSDDEIDLSFFQDVDTLKERINNHNR